MTQQEKQLLLIDLCARLPYGVKYKDAHGSDETLDIWHLYTPLNTILYDGKPSLYLRPMSSMTEEEKEEWVDLFMKPICELDQYTDEKEAQDMAPILYGRSHSLSTDWLNKKMFDYRGLISMNLSLEAPEGMYKF